MPQKKFFAADKASIRNPQILFPVVIYNFEVSPVLYGIPYPFKRVETIFECRASYAEVPDYFLGLRMELRLSEKNIYPDRNKPDKALSLSGLFFLSPQTRLCHLHLSSVSRH